MSIKRLFPIGLLLVVSILFFYKTFFHFQVPFPGDLLISQYSPWKYETYLGYNPGSYPHKAQYFDVARQLYPWKMFAVSELKSGRFPLWNPYNFSGMPFFANNQSAVLNPFNLLFFVFSPPIAWSFFIYLQPILASIFTYFYLKHLRLSVVSALFGSIAFSYSLFMTVFLEYGNFGYSFLFLPLLLLIVDKILVNTKTKWGILLPIIVAVTVFGGHFQISLGTLLFVIIYTFSKFYFLKIKKLKKASAVIVYFFMGVLVSMIQIVPLFELVSNSARVAHSSAVLNNNILIQLQQLILFFAPDAYGNPATMNYILKDTYPGNAIYVGVITLVFAILSLFKFKRSNSIKFFALVGAFFLAFMTRNPLSSFVYSFDIPFLSASSPSNFMYLLSFCISCLAAFGLNMWSEKYDKKVFISILFMGMVFFLFFGINIIFNIPLNTKLVFLSVLIFIVSTISVYVVFLLKKEKLIYLLLIILIVDLLYYFLKFNPFVPESLVYPETPITSFLQKNNNTRSWGYSAAAIEPNIQSFFGIYSPEGYDPIYPRWYGEFLYSSYDGKLLKTFNESTRSQAVIANGYAESDFSEIKPRFDVINQTGVGLILNRIESAAGQNAFNDKLFTTIYQKDGWTVYKNKSALPRVSMSKSGKLQIIEMSPSQIKIRTKSNTSEKLILLDTYYPGWISTIDGQKTDISVHNHTYRSILVPEGEHTILFSYQPQSFYLGLILTIMGIMGSVGFFVFSIRR